MHGRVTPVREREGGRFDEKSWRAALHSDVELALPLGIESPSLMNGLSGIGYGLWRLADPEHVPSVLTLAPPSGELDGLVEP